MHAGLFWCFHNPSNSDLDYRIFNMHIYIHVIFLHAYTHRGTSVNCVIWGAFVESAQDSREISGWAQSPAHNSRLSICWLYSIVHNFVFWEQVLFICATDSPVLFILFLTEYINAISDRTTSGIYIDRMEWGQHKLSKVKLNLKNS